MKRTHRNLASSSNRCYFPVLENREYYRIKYIKDNSRHPTAGSRIFVTGKI